MPKTRFQSQSHQVSSLLLELFNSDPFLNPHHPLEFIIESMRIEITELPEDKFRLDDLIQSPLLLRLLKATDLREFVLAVSSLKHE